jgi:hypothetical protein
MRGGPWVQRLWRGFWSGFLGGTGGGVIIGLGSYESCANAPVARIIPQIMLYALVVGTTTGIAAQSGTVWFRSRREAGYPAWFFNEPMGGLLAGAAGGALVGRLGGPWFGPNDCDYIHSLLLLGGALLGTILLSVATVLYASVADWTRVLVSCLSSAAVMTMAYLLASPLVEKIGDRYFVEPPYAIGGTILGTLVGGMMGAQVGLALFIYRTWHERADSQRAPSRFRIAG